MKKGTVNRSKEDTAFAYCFAVSKTEGTMWEIYW